MAPVLVGSLRLGPIPKTEEGIVSGAADRGKRTAFVWLPSVVCVPSQEVLVVLTCLVGNAQTIPRLMPIMCYSQPMSLTEYPLPSQELSLFHASIESLVLGWLAEFRSERTRQDYSRDLTQFGAFLREHSAGELLEVTRPHAALYARYLDQGPLAATSKARKLSACSSFYAYAVAREARTHNPFAGLARPKVRHYSPRLGLDLDSAPKVLQAIERMSQFHRCIVGLCLFLGLRVSEALSVTSHSFTENGGHRVVRFTGKGGEEFELPVSPQAWRLIEPMVTTHQHLLNEPLLYHGAISMNRYQVGRMVAMIGKKAGLDRKLTPHDLRHGAATCALEAGEPLHRVQQLLRHKDPRTTERYDHSRDRLDKSAAYGLGRALGGTA